MKQVVQTQINGQVRVEDVPSPVVRPGCVLVHNAYSLISAGTERAKVELARKPLLGKAAARPEQVQQVLSSVREQGLGPTYRKVMNRLESLEPLGYSCSGYVVAVGAGAEEFALNDRVACAGGGYANHAETVIVPKNLCAKLPPASAERGTLKLDDAAFATVGAIALHGVHQAGALVGAEVAVIGLGLVGLLTTQLLQAAGCRVFGFDPNSERCHLGNSFGCAASETDADAFLETVNSLTRNVGVDAAIVTAAASTNEPVVLAAGSCRDRGRIVIVGEVPIEVPRRLFYEKELELRISRSYGPGRYDAEYEEKGRAYPPGYVPWTVKRNLETFLRLVATGKVCVGPLITHRFPIERAETAYELITNGQEPYLGILLEYPGVRHPAAEEPNFLARSEKIPARAPAAAIDRARVGIGFIGAGNFAQNVLLPAIQTEPHVRFRGVASASGLTARDVSRRFGFEYSVADAFEVINDPEISTVFIATRHDLHASLTIAALQAGKNVFCEKPLALNAGELRQILRTYEEIGRTCASPPLLMVGYNRRFAPAVKVIKDFFAEAAEPLSLHYRVSAGYLPATHWLNDPTVGGGRLVGEGCHFIDLLIYLAGAPVTNVFARTLPDNGRYSQDNIIAQLQFANGSAAVLHYLANGDKRLGKERIEIFGGGATAVLDDFRRTTLSRGSHTQRQGRWFSAQDKGHRAEVGAFLGAVKNRRPSPIPFEEITLSSLVTFHVQNAIRSGGPSPIETADLSLASLAAAQDGC